MKKGYIVLENGQILEGTRFGYEGDAKGELVFNTSAVGYIETLTDACYQGQILVQTFPLIGNYGWIDSDTNGKEIKLSAYIVREWCEQPSNFRCEGTLDAELKKRKIPAICGVDTRQLTKIIRENGTMNAAICDDPSTVDLEELKAFKPDTVLPICEKQVFEAENASHKVTVINYGEPYGAVNSLVNRGCTVTVLPCNSSADEVLKTNPDGILLSGGAGDPSAYAECVAVIKALLGKKPIFGISLGHQLLALAKGAKTFKLPYGHRGASQPVKEEATGRTHITSQNHGYCVDADTVKAVGGNVTYINGNDKTCEGAEYAADKAFSVQFVPEKAFGEDNTENVLFGKFVSML